MLKQHSMKHLSGTVGCRVIGFIEQSPGRPSNAAWRDSFSSARCCCDNGDGELRGGIDQDRVAWSSA